MRWKRAGIAVLGLLTLLPATAAEAKSRVDSWNSRIQETVGLLRSGKAPEARAIIGPVLEEMTESVNPGAKAAHAFGLAMMLRALAEAGSGQEREAVWDWHVAQQLDPSLESWELGEFGVAGAMLDRHRMAKDPVPAALTSDDLEKEGAQKPVMGKPDRQPAYVEKSRLRRWRGSIVLQALVGTDGVPSYPRIVQTSEELAMVLSTCEFARELRFEPARRNGQPIAAIWDLTINYRLE